MKIYRMVEIDPNHIQIGDKMDVYLTNISLFKATAHRIEDDDTYTYITFMFDDCIAERPMNAARTNLGGYEASDMQKWLKEDIFPLFPDDLKNVITSLTLPSYGMIFGHDEWGDRTLESDDDPQFVLMKKRNNRVADFYDYEDAYWLRNANLQVLSSESFGLVDCEGAHTHCLATYPYGVRPVFTIALKRRGDVD